MLVERVIILVLPYVFVYFYGEWDETNVPCIQTRSLFAELTELPISVELSSAFLDEKIPVFRDDVCVFVSQSGETKDTLLALQYCKDRGALCVGVTNTVGSTISRETHCGVHINAGPEISVASTKVFFVCVYCGFSFWLTQCHKKAYTSQFIALTMFALQLSDDNYAKVARRKAIIDALFELSGNIRKALALEPQIKEIAKSRLSNIHDIIILGRGYQAATCLEAALKIKEVTYVHAEGILAGELKHGPLALIDSTVPVLMCMTQDRHYSDADNALKQVTARGGAPIIICSENDSSSSFDGLALLRVPTTVDAMQGIVNVIPFQLLAYHMAVARGINPDCPRNLAKSVTTA